MSVDVGRSATLPDCMILVSADAGRFATLPQLRDSGELSILQERKSGGVAGFERRER